MNPTLTMNAPDMLAPLIDLKSHDLADDFARPGVRYELRPGT